MQEKRTLYLAGKITGDPYYFTKFYNAQKKLEEGGFIVVNPALLPAEGFTWEACITRDERRFQRHHRQKALFSARRKRRSSRKCERKNKSSSKKRNPALTA